MFGARERTLCYFFGYLEVSDTKKDLRNAFFSEFYEDLCLADFFFKLIFEMPSLQSECHNVEHWSSDNSKNSSEFVRSHLQICWILGGIFIMNRRFRTFRVVFSSRELFFLKVRIKKRLFYTFYQIPFCRNDFDRWLHKKFNTNARFWYTLAWMHL